MKRIVMMLYDIGVHCFPYLSLLYHLLSILEHRLYVIVFMKSHNWASCMHYFSISALHKSDYEIDFQVKSIGKSVIH